MKKELVEVVFDRRKNSEKRGYGFLEVQVYLGRATRKYIMIGKYSSDEWQAVAASPENQSACQQVQENYCRNGRS